MNAISPYYFQGLNIILEFDRVNKKTGKLEHVWNTCNITSLSMTLEALGKSAADYKYPHADPADRQGLHEGHRRQGAGKVGSDLAGLRLPDYVAMAAIAWQMGYKTGNDDAILKGGNDAFNAIPSADAIATLAADFGAKATKGHLATADDLASYGKDHWKAADNQATDETKKNRTADSAPPTPAASPPPRSSARSRSSATRARSSPSSAHSSTRAGRS